PRPPEDPPGAGAAGPHLRVSGAGVRTGGGAAGLPACRAATGGAGEGGGGGGSDGETDLPAGAEGEGSLSPTGAGAGSVQFTTGGFSRGARLSPTGAGAWSVRTRRFHDANGAGEERPPRPFLPSLWPPARRLPSSSRPAPRPGAPQPTP